MITAGQSVHLVKLSAHREPEGMLPTSYWLRGVVQETPRIGAPLRVCRTQRAAQTPDETEPVECLGLYTSSPIREMIEGADGVVTVTTENSVWRITPKDA